MMTVRGNLSLVLAAAVGLLACDKAKEKETTAATKPQTPQAICDALIKEGDIIEGCTSAATDPPTHREARINFSGQPAYAIMIDQAATEEAIEKKFDEQRALVKTMDTRSRKYSQHTTYKRDRKRHLLVTIIGGFDRSEDAAPKLDRMLKVMALEE